MQGWEDRSREMQYSRRKPRSCVELFGITFKAMGVPGADTQPQVSLCRGG